MQFHNGLYILNEGNMGSNKSTIDFYSLSGDSIIRDIYPQINPTVIKELGDVGNDIVLYGGHLYATINVSGKVEVCDAQCRRITQVDIPNCRQLCCQGGYVYVTSYAGPIDYANPNYAQRGYVAKIDTLTNTLVDTCHVGFQPDGIACDGHFLYVANSGGYMAPNYDSTLSVISLETFREVKRIPVAANLDQVLYDPHNQCLYVTARGDYYQAQPCLYRVALDAQHTITNMGFAVSKMMLIGQSLYFYSQDYVTDIRYGIFHTDTHSVSELRLSNAAAIKVPYCIFALQENGDFFVTDARDYVTPGVLYRYNNAGTLLSQHRTGDIPGHICRKL